MDIFKSYKFYKICLFSLFLILPFCSTHCHEQISKKEMDFIFMNRMNHINNKIEKYKNELNFGKLLDQIVNLKYCVNAYTGQETELFDYLENLIRDLKLRGVPLSNCDVGELSQILWEKEKHRNQTLNFTKRCYIQMYSLKESNPYSANLSALQPESLNYALYCFDNGLEYDIEEESIIFSLRSIN